jgi:hypothetical protein
MTDKLNEQDAKILVTIHETTYIWDYLSVPMYLFASRVLLQSRAFRSIRLLSLDRTQRWRT